MFEAISYWDSKVLKDKDDETIFKEIEACKKAISKLMDKDWGSMGASDSKKYHKASEKAGPIQDYKKKLEEEIKSRQ